MEIEFKTEEERNEYYGEKYLEMCANTILYRRLKEKNMKKEASIFEKKVKEYFATVKPLDRIFNTKGGHSETMSTMEYIIDNIVIPNFDKIFG